MTRMMRRIVCMIRGHAVVRVVDGVGPATRTCNAQGVTVHATVTSQYLWFFVHAGRRLAGGASCLQATMGRTRTTPATAMPR